MVTYSKEFYKPENIDTDTKVNDLVNFPVLNSNDVNVDIEKIRQLILVHGVVVVRNGDCSREDFLSLSNIIGTNFVSLEGGADKGRIGGGYSGRDFVHGTPSLFSVTGKGFGHAIPLHGELYFQSQRPPQLIWFYCQTPPQHGGQTLFCDGQTLFSALPNSIQECLLCNDLCYIRRLDADIWPEYFGMHDPIQVANQCRYKGIEALLNADGSMTTKFRGPAVSRRQGVPSFINNLLPFALREIGSPNETRAQVRFASGEKIPEEVILKIEQVASGLTVAIDWEAGDIAIVDNTRVMHGRNAVNDSRREIFVRISNAEFLEFDPIRPQEA